MRPTPLTLLLFTAITLPGRALDLPPLSLRQPELPPLKPIANVSLRPMGGPPLALPAFPWVCVYVDGFWPDKPPPPIDGLIELFGSRENYALALAAERIELTLLKAKPAATSSPENYLEIAESALSPADMGTLIGTLTSDATYDWREEYYFFEPPAPVYRFRVKFWSGHEVVMLDLSLRDTWTRVVKNGREVAGQSFVNGRQAIESLLERHFPDDVGRSR